MTRLVMLSLGICLLLSACDDPNDPNSWIKKLRDPKQRQNAVMKIRRLTQQAKTDADRAAIAKTAVPALCKLFKDFPEAATLKTIILYNDKASVPTLLTALDFVGEEYHNATLAAKALAKMKAPEAVAPLCKILDRPLAIKSRANLAKLAAIGALGQIGDPKAVPCLIKAADVHWTKQDFHLNKKAIENLGLVGDARAVPVVIRGLFMTSRRQGNSYNKSRTALVRIGRASIKPLIKALKGEDAAVNKMAKDQEFRKGVVMYKTAVALGDLRAAEAVPVLVEILAKANVGDEYDKGLDGLIEGLGKIGGEGALEHLHKLVQDPKANVKIRQWVGATLAVIGSKKSLPVLLKVADKGDIQGYPDLRGAAIGVYAQMVGAEAEKDYAFVEQLANEKRLKGYAAAANFKESLKLMAMAKKCKDNGKCYGKELENTKHSPGARLKAAVMVGILPSGHDAVESMTKVLPQRDFPLLRQVLLLSATRVITANDKGFVDLLTKLANKESKRKSKFTGGTGLHNVLALELIKRKKKASDPGN